MQNLLALLLLLITATAAVPSPPDGPVLTVKHHENNHLTFVGIGCQVYIYNGTTVVANTNKLISNSLCLNVAGIGLSTNGSKALITLSGSNQMYLIVLQENITLSGGIHINIDVIKLAKPIGFSSLGRVQNSIVGNTTTMSNMFFIAANRVNESGAIVSFEVGDFIGVKSILYIPSSNVNDVRPIVSKSLSSTLFLVSANKGLYKIMWNGVKLSMEGMLIPTDPGNDGLDVGINLHTAYIAAQGSGLRIADLQKKSIVGSIKVNGWAGGVRAEAGYTYESAFCTVNAAAGVRRVQDSLYGSAIIDC